MPDTVGNFLEFFVSFFGTYLLCMPLWRVVLHTCICQIDMKMLLSMIISQEVLLLVQLFFSLEQNISRFFRQAFIHCCELHQVWEQPSIIVIIYVASTLWAHALYSEHAQSDLWLPAVGYWLDWFGLDHYCVCAIGFGKSPI